MKTAIFATLFAGAAAFAPVQNGRTATSLLAAEKSEALPFLPAPPNLKGYVGDVGFDPLRISDYVPMDYLREAELKHGRICMLAWTGWVTVDLGVRIVAMPQEWEGLTSATAHDKLCEYGAMGNMAIWLGLAEIVSWLGVAQMLQGSGREPGDFGIGKQFLEGKTKEQVDRVKLQELKNGRLAMFAFSGVVTQSILSGNGFPYTM